jgi:hypothetical protein
VKITLKFITFTLTFSLALAVVSLTNSFLFRQSCNTERGLQTKVKIYNFLQADKARWQESRDKSIALRLQPKPNAMQELGKARKKIIFELYETRMKVDTSELPEDFKAGWSKFLKCEKYTLRLIYPEGTVEGPVKEEERKEVIEETQSFENEYKNVAGNYGFKLNASGTLADEEN